MQTKMIKYEELNVEFLFSIFPEFEEEIRSEVEGIGEFLPHCVFGNVLNSKVVEFLKREDYLENQMLHRIFRMYEEFAVAGDEETQNLLQVTHFAKSRQDLGYNATKVYYQDVLKRCHPSNKKCVEQKLQDAKECKGRTILEIIIDIILDTDDSGHYCELEIEE